MVSSFTPNKSIEQPANNDYVDSWDIPVNADWSIIDKALGASVSINLTGLSGNQTLTLAQYQPLKIVLSGSPTAAVTMRVPSGKGGLWVVRNDTTGGFAISISSLAGGGPVPIPAGTHVLVSCDGTATGMFLAMTAPGPAGGLPTQVQYNNAGTISGHPNLTWNGTTLTTTGLTNTGNTVLGNAITDTTTVSGPLTLGGTVTFSDGTTQTSGGWRRLFRVSPAEGANDIQLRNIPADINDLTLHIDLTPIADDDNVWMQVIDVAGNTLAAAGTYAWASTHCHAPSAGVGSTSSSTSAANTTFIMFNLDSSTYGVSSTHGIRVRATINNIRGGRNIGMSWQASYWSPSGYFNAIAGSGWVWWPNNISGIRISTSGAAARLHAGGVVTLWGSP